MKSFEFTVDSAKWVVLEQPMQAVQKGLVEEQRSYTSSNVTNIGAAQQAWRAEFDTCEIVVCDAEIDRKDQKDN